MSRSLFENNDTLHLHICTQYWIVRYRGGFVPGPTASRAVAVEICIWSQIRFKTKQTCFTAHVTDKPSPFYFYNHVSLSSGLSKAVVDRVGICFTLSGETTVRLLWQLSNVRDYYRIDAQSFRKIHLLEN